jgi:hypothetical protein
MVSFLTKTNKMKLVGKAIISFFVSQGLICSALAKNQRLRAPKNQQPKSGGRKLTNFECTLVIKAIAYDETHGEEILECQLPGDGLPIPLVNMPDWLSEKFSNGDIVSNVDSLKLSEALIHDGEEIYIPSDSQASLVKGTDDRRRRLTTGNLTLMAMRVTNTGQTNPSYTNAGFADSIFGDAGDVFNLKSGYDQCSYGKLTFSAGNGNGVVDVSTSVSNDDNTITDAALIAAGLGSGGGYNHVSNVVLVV